MLKKIADFILLSMGITPKDAEPKADRWAEARRRAEQAEREHAAAREDETNQAPADITARDTRDI